MPIIGPAAPVPEVQLKDIPLELFGGLVNEMQGGDLPEGASPDNQNVDYEPGAVFTRAGLTAIFSGQVTGSVNYFKNFSLPNTDLQLLVLDSSGDVKYEDTENNPGTLNLIGTVQAGCYGQSVTQFGREYIAFSDSRFGLDMPRQWDGQYFDRVSQVGPGAPPGIAELVGGLSYPIEASPTGLVQVSQFAVDPGSNLGVAGFAAVLFLDVGTLQVFPDWVQPGAKIILAGCPLVGGKNFDNGVGGNPAFYTVSARGKFGLQDAIWFTVTQFVAILSFGVTVAMTINGTVATMTMTSFVPNMLVGSSFTITGATDASWDGTYTILSVVTAGTVFTFDSGIAHTDSGGGSLVVPGNLSAGEYRVVVSFLTRQGYITKPSPPALVTVSAGSSFSLTNIPIGPDNVVARILSFTAAGGGFYFYIPLPTTGSLTGTVLKDNTSTSMIVDFSDSTLLAAASIDSPGNNLFALEELGECLGVISFAGRMLWWGERNKLQSFLNLTFDGGFDPTDTTPLGWAVDVTDGAGGSKVNPGYGAFGFAYKITGDGAGTIFGKIYQSAYANYLNVPILLPNTEYSMRVRVKHSGALTGATLVVKVTSASTSFVSRAEVPGASITSGWLEFIVPFDTAMPSSTPSDLILSMALEFAAASSEELTIDNFQIFPTAEPYRITNIRASYVANPESFDGVTGSLGLADQNGQPVMACFKLRDNLYIGKGNSSGGSLFTTTDNGQTEPFGWSISTISQSVGVLSVHAAVVGEEWALLGSRLGLYLFNGNEPVKISQEIQPSWDGINWAEASKLWMTNDLVNRRVLVGAPMGENEIPNQVLMMNYREINFSSALATQGPLRMGAGGKITSTDLARKWSMWTISANAAALVTRPAAVTLTMFGNNSGASELYFLDEAALSDDGEAINSYYDTYFFASREQETDMQLGHHRHFYGYLVLTVAGAGSFASVMTANVLGNIRTKTLASRTLAAVPLFDTEIPVNYTADRVSFKFRTNAAGAYFKLNKMVVTMSQDPWIAVRGRT